MILIDNIKDIYGKAGANEPGKDGFILLEGSKIKELGSINSKEYKKLKQDENVEIYDAENMIALPGLINTHTHAGMNLLRGYADDLNLQTWLQDKIWPFESRMDAEDIYWGTKLAITEMLKNGVTTFNDMYFAMDKVVSAVEETGIRAVLGYGLIEANDGQEGLDYTRRFIQEYEGYLDNRLTLNIAPHSPYTCSRDYLEEVMKLADDYNKFIHIHIAETAQEVKDLKDEIDLTPVEYLDKIGLFDFPTLGAHCVHLSDEDIQILADKDVHVSHNPASNLKLGSGIMPLIKLKTAGVNVALGTDGAGSNNGLDLIHDARLASYIQKGVNHDPTAVPIQDIFKMLTLNGAKALQLGNVGVIEEGMEADIILINPEKIPSYHPDFNSLSNIFYAGNGRDVDTVFVAGEMLVKDGELISIDQEEIFAEVKQRAERLA
ncbi:MAG: amidohydrolase [Bacillota bacterium]